MKHHTTHLAVAVVVIALAPLAQTAIETVTHLVTFEIAIDGEPAGKITMGLFGKAAPKTVKNFYTFATTGYKNRKYEGSVFHHVHSELIEGGDFENGNGTGGFSIYGKRIRNENVALKHSAPGLLATAGHDGPFVGSQFAITTHSDRVADWIHYVFGKVTEETYGLLARISAIPTDNEYQPKPLKQVKITKSYGKVLPINKQFRLKFNDYPPTEPAANLSFTYDDS